MLNQQQMVLSERLSINLDKPFTHSKQKISMDTGTFTYKHACRLTYHTANVF